jgi:hypothetical protein
MSKELVTKLKPWVTAFSEGIRYSHKKADELRVGGSIDSIFDMSELTDDSEWIKKYSGEMVQMMIDDEVGKILLLIPKEAYDDLNKDYSFKDGMVVIAKGKLLEFEKDIYRPNAKTNTSEPRPSATLLCWKVEPIQEPQKS